ncbi:unnamed protein product, partial [Rotaria magnacalcarata]
GLDLKSVSYTNPPHPSTNAYIQEFIDREPEKLR